MRNLILLFIRNGGGLTFLALELVCFVLIVQFNDAQGRIFFSSLNNVSGMLDDKISEAGDYFQLREITDSLAEENAALYSMLRYQRSSGQSDTLSEFSSADSAYQFIPVRVIRNSVNRTNNYLRIDKGRLDGVEPNMGVVSHFGVVGIVVDVTDHYGLVMSMLHQESRISAAIRGKGHFGSLVWDGGSPVEGMLLDVPKHASIAKADSIETSGYSLLFPPGLPLGRIDTFWVGQGSSTYTIQVRLNQDLSRINTAYVVKLRDKEELELLEAGGLQ